MAESVHQLHNYFFRKITRLMDDYERECHHYNLRPLDGTFQTQFNSVLKILWEGNGRLIQEPEAQVKR